MMLPATKTRRVKGIAEVVIIIVILVMAMVAAILVWFFVMPTLSGGSGVTYGLGVSGTGSTDGSRVVISISIQNSGSKPIQVQGVWISPGGSGAPTTATVSSVQPTSIPTSAVTYGTTPPATRPAGSLVVQPGTSATITIVLTGTGFYRGTPLMVTVYAVDATNQALTNDQSTRFTLS
ncbi:MAG: hypothetical protein QXI64_10370 [Sulfolobales archaeon]